MKTAVASTGKTVDSLISDQAGRAEYYLIYEDGNLVETIDNPFKVGGGAGFAVVKMLADKKVDTVLAGRFGVNMEEALKERGLNFNIADGTAEEAIESMK